MLSNKYSVSITSLLLTLMAASVFANPSIPLASEKSENSEDVPSEEFWLYMAEFAEDEELMEPDVLINESNLNQQSVKVSEELKSSTANNLPESNEESL